MQASTDCYLSIGHRRALIQFHTHVLRFEEDGHHSLMTSEEYGKIVDAIDAN